MEEYFTKKKPNIFIGQKFVIFLDIFLPGESVCMIFCLVNFIIPSRELARAAAHFGEVTGNWFIL